MVRGNKGNSPFLNSTNIPIGMLCFLTFVLATLLPTPSAHSKGLEKGITSTAISLENDIFTPGKRDQDYTAGFAITLGGQLQRKQPSIAEKLLHPGYALSTIDRLFDLSGPNSISAQSLEVGLFGFTPENISANHIQTDDRPYSSLLYTSALHEYANPNENRAWVSSLTIGVLGLDLMKNAQKAVHDATDSEETNGWHHQISEGGELTGRYSLGLHRLLRPLNAPLNYGIEVKDSLTASVGYLTEASYSVGFRWGKIHSPWWSLKPETASYGEQSSANTYIPGQNEHYLWGGVAFRARAYNAFLQGQFRESALTYSASQLNHGIVEAWLGYSVACKNGHKFSYVLRGHTSELKAGIGDRAVVWGGLTYSKVFR